MILVGLPLFGLPFEDRMPTEPTLTTRRPGPRGNAPSVGSVVGDGYALHRLLGAGGMGVVYEAEDANGERVAVKMLLEEYTDLDEARVRFERESKLTAALFNEHIVATLDFGVDEQSGTPFMVMPLMVGYDLHQLLDDIGPVHPTVATRIIRQTCVGLAAAHAAGVVHRDIKPANIFLDHEPDGTVTVRLMDLGIAKWRDVAGDLTKTGSSLGTPRYMAPEQVSDAKQVEAVSDIWGLAVTLYELLCGVQPFGEWTELADVWLAIATVDPVLIQEHAPWVDPGLATVVHGAMLRDAEARCPSADELHGALEPFAGGSDDLNAAMLHPLSPELQDRLAQTAERPTSWQAQEAAAPAPAIAEIDDDPLLGQTIDGRYVLLRCLGQGGMGAVYEAALDDGSRVAIKIIRPEIAGSSRTARRRFVREAKVVESLHSEHIVRVCDVGADPEHELPFIAMELLAGADLEHALRKHGALPPQVIARLFLQAGLGLSAAHELGFVHRDVKPANLFLALDPEANICLKVCDFGVAKQLAPEPGNATTAHLTRSGSVIGSPMYMSPEQAKNDPSIDERSDVWSLGATMYEALAGMPPWAGRTSVPQIIVALCSEELTPIQDHAPWIPASIATIVHRAMQKSPDDRYASMHDMCEALEQVIISDAPVHADDLRAVSEDARKLHAGSVADALPAATGAGTTNTVEDVPPPSRRGMTALLPWVAIAAVAYFVISSANDDPQAATAPAPLVTASSPPTSATPSSSSATHNVAPPSKTDEPHEPPAAALSASTAPSVSPRAGTPQAQPPVGAAANRPAPATAAPGAAPPPQPPADLDAREKW